jgi:hypothetical protein
VLLTMLGATGESLGMDRLLKFNTAKAIPAHGRPRRDRIKVQVV